MIFRRSLLTKILYRQLPLRAALFVVLSILFAKAALAQESVVHFEPAQTKITFTLDDPLHTVRGTFRLKQGEVRFNHESGAASGALVIDAKSGDSGSAGRDKKMHREVIESDKFPEITFIPQKIIGDVPAQGVAQVQVAGIFRIHGADHPLTLAVPLQISGSNVKVTTSFDVPYVAWGMKDPSVFMLRVKKSVRIEIEATGQISATK
jgi:polyisoprenoid-binding protein YceI